MKQLHARKRQCTPLAEPGEWDLDPAVLAGIREGIQLWDPSGSLLYANRASREHFRGVELVPGDSFAGLVSRCLDEAGRPLLNHRFPVARVMESGTPATDVLVRVEGEEPLWLRLNAYPVTLRGTSRPAILATSHEISALVEKSRSLERHAHYDALTGLPNRALLGDRLGMAVAHCKRRQEVLAVCMMDLDGFKPVNDTLGHEAGDQLLQEIARRLVNTLRSEDTAIRLGGDEFVLLLGGLKSDGESELVLKRVLDAVSRPMVIQGRTVQVTASLGVTLYPNDAAEDDQLLRHADQAMYRAKERGKNDYHLYNPTLESRHRANRSAVERIARALASEQFELYYQPQVDCLRGKVHGVEALIRWNHPILGIRSPAEFLPLIEQEDLIIDVGNWVMESALRQLAVWRDQGLDLTVGVNISARHLLRGGFAERLSDLLERHPRELLQRMEVEILETAALEDMKSVGLLVERFRAKGIAFALDDFGTGFSSLSHLKHLPVNTMKIDQSFIRDMLSDPGDLAIVQGIIGLSEAFQCRVVAEGVQGIDQILTLLGIGCQLMQGYGISRPMPAERLPGWIREFHENPLWHTAQDHYPSRQSFDLLLMEVTQRYWFDQVVKYLERAEPLPEEQLPHGYEEARITRWYREEGARHFGEMPEFHDLDVLHREVHRLAASLLAGKGSREEGEEPMQRFRVANDRLIAALQRFRGMMVVNRGLP